MEERAHPPIELPEPSKSGNPWLASHLLQRQVVNIVTLEPLGRIIDVMFDPQNCVVVGVTIHLDNASRGAGALIGRAFGRRTDIGALTLDHIVSLNGDVVTVNASPAQFSQVPALDGMLSLTEVCELVILTTYGMSLGALADILLDYRGSEIVGYVVQPTTLAQSILPLLSDLAELEPEPDEVNVVNAADVPPTPALPASHLRFIPAASRVHFGESLIMVVSDVEPLRPQGVVISQQSGGLTTTAHALKKKWLSE
ncbi:MAG: hypothetical protein ACHQ1E_04820 [Ktedonobacterales bacterium]